MTDVLEIHDEGRLRILRMNRPERKNALNGELLHALDWAFRDAAADDGVWAIVLTGNGTAFSSGADVGDSGTFGGGSSSDDAAGARPQPARGEGPAYLAMTMRDLCDKPIVAGVNGTSVGAGVSLALAADIRIAAPSATFHPGYSRIAISPDLGLTWTLTRAVGYERALRFLLEQRTIDAATAERLGLVSEVVATDEALDDRVVEYGTMLTRVAPRAARQTKRLLNAVDQPADLPGHMQLELDLVMSALRTKDCAEAVRALMTRSTPEFTGE